MTDIKVMKSGNNMAEVQEDLKLLQTVTFELMSINKKAKELREIKKELSEKLLKFCQDNEHPGIKYGKIQIINCEKSVRKRLKPKEKISGVEEYLKSIGVAKPDKAAKEVLDAMKGEEEEVNKLSIKVLKD